MGAWEKMLCHSGQSISDDPESILNSCERANFNRRVRRVKLNQGEFVIPEVLPKA